MRWLVVALAAIKAKLPEFKASTDSAKDLKEDVAAIDDVMNNVDTIQAKTAQKLNKMEKSDFFALPDSVYQDPGPETPRYKLSAPSSFVQEDQDDDDDAKKQMEKLEKKTKALEAKLPKEEERAKTFEKQMDQYVSLEKQRAQKVQSELKELHAKRDKIIAENKAESAEVMKELRGNKADATVGKRQKTAAQVLDQLRKHGYGAAKTKGSSFAQTSENPDDGFAKVEAKLKALQEKIKADTAKFEQEAKAAPSSLLQQGEQLNVEGLHFQLGSSTLQEEQEGFAALKRKMQNVAKMQAETQQELNKMQQDSFFKLPANAVKPTSLLQEKINVDTGLETEDGKLPDDPKGDKLKAEVQVDDSQLQQLQDKFDDDMANLHAANSEPFHESGRFRELERTLKASPGLRTED